MPDGTRLDPRAIFKSTVTFSEPEAVSEDEYTFVMSDETPDRFGDVVDSAGWKLANFRQNPIALLGHDHRDIIGNWINVHVENKRLIGTLRLAEAGTSPVVDSTRSFLRQKVLKGASVGFKPLKHEAMDEPPGAWRFLSSELLECSVVAVPANPAAIAIKDLHPSVQRIFEAESGMRTKRRDGPTAEPGDRPPTLRAKTMSISQQIETAQAELIRVRDALIPYARKIEGEEDLLDDETVQMKTLEGELNTAEAKLANLRVAERALGRGTALTPAAPSRPSIMGAPAAPAIVTSLRGASSKERPMDLIFKVATCHAIAHVTRRPVETIQLERYGERDDVGAVIKAAAQTNPALTTVTGWAAELVSNGTLDMLDTLNAVSAYAQLSSLGLRFSFGRNGTLKIPRRNKVTKAPGDLRAAWIGEGAAIPVRRGSFGAVTLAPKKVGVISEYSREMAMYSTPNIEQLIRDGIIEDTADTLDGSMLDNVASSAARPAGLLNGVAPITGTTGTDYAAMVGDMQKALAPFVAANAATGLAWLMNPMSTLAMSMVNTSTGERPFEADMRNLTLAGFPVISSTSVTVKTLTLVRAVDFLSSIGDEPQFETSDQATLVESDGDYPADNTATVPPITTAGATPALPANTGIRSLFQTATFAIRMIMDVDWAMRRSGMVQQVTTNWG